MTVSTRTRFEILKRDGFRCKYCGCSAMTSVLHVDHVIAVANEGTDDPQNLITSCERCNLGKSDVPLDESRLPEAEPVERMQEHAAQMRAYLEMSKALLDAHEQHRADLAEHWRKVTKKTATKAMVTRFVDVVETHGVSTFAKAVDITAAKAEESGFDAATTYRYFNGVVKNVSNPPGRDEGQAPPLDPGPPRSDGGLVSPRAAKQQKQKITPFLQVTAADLGMPLSVGARLLWMFLRLHCCRCRDEDGAPVYETKIITLDTLVEALGGGTVAKEVGVRGQPGAKVAKECARFGRDAISAAIKELVDGGHIEARRTNRGAYRNVFHFSIAKTAPVDDRQSPVEVA